MPRLQEFDRGSRGQVNAQMKEYALGGGRRAFCEDPYIPQSEGVVRKGRKGKRNGKAEDARQLDTIRKSLAEQMAPLAHIVFEPEHSEAADK